MAKLGTDKKPVRFRTQTEVRLGEIAKICEDNGWKYIGGWEPNKPEDISEVEYLLNPKAFSSESVMKHSNYPTVIKDKPKIGRNDLCPCGSGLKYKKCCIDITTDNTDDLRDHVIPRNVKIEYGTPLLDEKFFEVNSINELSAQRLVYSHLLSPGMEKLAYQISSKFITRSKNQENKINKISCAEDLIDLMNSNLDIINHSPFKEKALEYKETFIPLLINDLKNPKDDAFIELAIRIIHGSGQDLSKDIIHLIKSNLNIAYHVSQFCVLLGFYPSEESEQLLWDYFHYFKNHCPEKSYKDGPLLGLIEIKEQKKEKYQSRLQVKS